MNSSREWPRASKRLQMKSAVAQRTSSDSSANNDADAQTGRVRKINHWSFQVLPMMGRFLGPAETDFRANGGRWRASLGSRHIPNIESAEGVRRRALIDPYAASF